MDAWDQCRLMITGTQAVRHPIAGRATRPTATYSPDNEINIVYRMQFGNLHFVESLMVGRLVSDPPSPQFTPRGHSRFSERSYLEWFLRIVASSANSSVT